MSIASPPFRASRMIGLSWAGGEAPPTAVAALTLLEGWTVHRGPGWLLAAERADCIAADHGHAVAVAVPRMLDRAGGRLLGAEALLAGLGQGNAPDPAGMAPPFRALWLDDGAVLHAATDHAGLGHLFVAQAAAEGTGAVAAVATSPELLAKIVGRAVAADALAEFALFGAFVADRTPFAGIRKLMAGERAVLRQGRLQVQVPPVPSAAPGTLVDATRAAVAAMLRAAPDAGLELSGGLDSRIVLAAIPPADRADRVALTIGPASGDTADIRIARQLARASGIEHRIVDFDRARDLDADGFATLLASLIDGYEQMANPIDKVSVALAGNDPDARPRFSGQNGEIARGFYYPGQPLTAAPTPALAQGLIAWRLVGNDRVAADLLLPDFIARQDVARDAMTRTILSFDAGDGNGTEGWGRLLDRFYLGQRMQAWAGNAGSNRFIDRTILWPFFDRDVVAAAIALPPAEKAGSLAAYRLLAALDRDLAAVPLDSGAVPAAMAAGGLSSRIAGWRRAAGRVSAKLSQRVLRRSRGTLGSGDAIALWHHHGLHRQLDIHALSRLDVFRPAALEAIAAGTLVPDRPSLGFLLLCDRLARR